MVAPASEALVTDRKSAEPSGIQNNHFFNQYSIIAMWIINAKTATFLAHNVMLCPFMLVYLCLYLKMSER